MSVTKERAVALHNSGWAPRASIAWHGFRRTQINDTQLLIEQAKTTGTWLACTYKLTKKHSLYERDWNNCKALLRVLVREGEFFEVDKEGAKEGAKEGQRVNFNDLSESQCRAELVKRIEAHARALDWPPNLINDEEYEVRTSLKISDPLTAFVALSKSTGSVWMRDRPVRLAPLHLPTQTRAGDEGKDAYAEWSSRLFFPNGVPSNLLKVIANQYKRSTRQSKKSLGGVV
jgi:hypothetical protein